MGGLAAALRLRAAGHAVRVLERRPALGGKLDVRVRDGFTFDTGPSLLTLPGVLDELFRVAGTRLAAEVDLTRLDPQIRYRWPDGSGFDACDDPEATSRAVEAFSPGGGAALPPLHGPRRAHLGRQRAHVPGRADERTARPAAPDALAPRPHRHRPRAHPRRRRPADLLRPPPGPVGRALRHLLGLLALPGAGHAGLHPRGRGPARCLVPGGRDGGAARRPGPGGRADGRGAGDGVRGRAHRGVGRPRPRRRDGGRHAAPRRRGRGQRRRRAPLPRPPP